MPDDTFYVNSRYYAKESALDYLCASMGSKREKDAFLGGLPAGINVWAFFVGGGTDARNTFNVQADEVHEQADIVGYFDEQRTGDAFVMLLRRALPIRHHKNIQMLRIRNGGNPRNDLAMRAIGNEPDDLSPVWVVEAGMEIVYSTRGDLPPFDPATGA